MLFLKDDQPSSVPISHGVRVDEGIRPVIRVVNLKIIQQPTIPALSGWGLLVLSVLFLSVGLTILFRSLALRRRRSIPSP